MNRLCACDSHIAFVSRLSLSNATYIVLANVPRIRFWLPCYLLSPPLHLRMLKVFPNLLTGLIFLHFFSLSDISPRCLFWCQDPMSSAHFCKISVLELQILQI